MNKKIKNIVFYKFWDPTRQEPITQACIFYDDKTVKNTSYEEGKELSAVIAREEKIRNQDEFVRLFNSKRIFTMTGEEFERRFKEFLGTGVALVPMIPSSKTNEAENNTQNSGKTGASSSNNDRSSSVIPPIDPGNNNNNNNNNNNKGSSGILPGKKKKKRRKKNKSKNNKPKKGFFSKLWVKITAFVLAASMFLTGGYFLGRNTKSGKIISNNITQNTQNQAEPQDEAYLSILAKSTNDDQKKTMTHQSQSLDVFNRDFANKYVESEKDVKASLTWDEIISLNLAYNTHTKDQIKAMFNGAEVDATALTDAYKNANLQLMGAYVISTRENPVNSAAFLTDPNQTAFVEKYSDLFYKMKEKKGDEQVAAINAFYSEINKDFPITDKVREEGISHAEGRTQIETYKAAVTPMVAAAEIMFQNTSGIDRTLSDKAIKYFNDIGLCNRVAEKFERAETITIAADTDEKQPLYTEFRDAKIAELMYEGNYPLNDAHRDLSALDSFQKWVNGRFELVNGELTSKVKLNSSTSSKSTSTKKETKTTVTSDRVSAVTAVGEAAVIQAENKVKADLDAQNQDAISQAKAEADATSAEAKRKENEAASKLNEDISNANNTIANGGTVNEKDFKDADVDFFDEYEDGNGNLADFVEGIVPVDGTKKTETANNSTTNDDIYEYEEPYINPDAIEAYVDGLDGVGVTETGKVYTKH